MLYSHWSEVPRSGWPCEYFSAQEIACKGTEALLVHIDALRALDALRRTYAQPIFISSAYRSAYHNAVVGGAPMSSHLGGHAFDVQLRGADRHQIRSIAEEVGFTGFGMNYISFVHIDMGRRREW